MNISDEAVEAAYKAHLGHKSVRSPSNARNAMRAAVEAAAPYLLHTVWDEAYGKGFEAARGEPDTPNPYRGQS